MIINCIIIDDEPLAIKIIEQYISNVSELNLVATFENPINAIETLHSSNIDLVFLDIQMPLITGVDFIKNTEIKAQIIFTTAHRNYAHESYELDVIDYLLKPISFARFLKSINKFKKSISSKDQISIINNTKDYIYVNSNKKYLKISFSSILYIDSIKDYINIHTKDDIVITKEKISSFIEKLPSNFIRTHRSYIVNKDKITALTAKDVEIGNIEIPISESYKSKVKSLTSYER